MAADTQIAYRVSWLVLKSVPLLAILSERQLSMLAQVSSRKWYARNETIIEAGEVSDTLYIILSGHANVILKEPRHGEIIVFTLKPGEFFGEMSLLDRQPRSASVIANEACELLMLKGSDFAAYVSRERPLAAAVLRELVSRLRVADERISSLALMDVYGRVARWLLERSEVIDGQKVVNQRINRTEIAKMVGASREMVSKVMKDLIERRRIEVKGKSIVLADGLLDWD
jgi:CRP/FNR family cyclic AMP-dependent transcriptional regulator